MKNSHVFKLFPRNKLKMKKYLELPSKSKENSTLFKTITKEDSRTNLCKQGDPISLFEEMHMSLITFT
jgi:hypothetical protein